MDLNKNINNIIGTNNYTPSNILKKQVPYGRNPKMIQRVNYSDINNRIKQIFDKIPEVNKATGMIIVNLKDGKTLKININYQ